MSMVASSLNSSLASTGLSAADAGQIAAAKETLDKTLSNTANPPVSEKTNKVEDSAPTKISARARELSAAEQRRVAQLQRIDSEVRAHEQAHINAGHGVVTSGPSYTYTYGPDGKQYAVAGEVGIDTSPEKKPEANINKGQRIQAAALAPAQPSPQDRQVASTGVQLEERGRIDLAAQFRADQAAEDAAAKAAQTKAEIADQRAAVKNAEEKSAEEAKNDSASLPPPESSAAKPSDEAPPAAPQPRPVQTYANLSALGTRQESGQKYIDIIA